MEFKQISVRVLRSATEIVCRTKEDDCMFIRATKWGAENTCIFDDTKIDNNEPSKTCPLKLTS